MDSRIVREGVIAGLIGAATVAAWFFAFDVFQGAPFQTPAALWAGLLPGGAPAGAISRGFGPVLGYTVLHVLTFVVFGIVASWLFAGADREPAMLIPILIFFGAFEVFFLALVAFLARPVLGLVAGWAILIGNFLAAVTMLWYFFVSHRPLVQTLGGRWTAVFREGIAAGLLGGAVVALWFLLYDTVSGRPLRTPALLGATLLEGLRDPGALDIRLDVVLGYTVVHFAVFAAFGILVSVLFSAAEREPRVLLGLFILFWCFELFFLGFVLVLDEALVGALLWWNIVIANLLAALSMLLYFFVRHRALGARLLERWSED
jgi:hypothetical protein